MAQGAIENMQGDSKIAHSKRRKALNSIGGFLVGIALFFGIKYAFHALSARNQAAALRERLAAKSLLFPSYEEHGFQPEAFVLFYPVSGGFGRLILGWPTVGFGVGDGSLVLTAAHVLDAVTAPPSQATCEEHFVLSLHHGDLFPYRHNCPVITA